MNCHIHCYNGRVRPLVTISYPNKLRSGVFNVIYGHVCGNIGNDNEPKCYFPCSCSCVYTLYNSSSKINVFSILVLVCVA